jgi:hypothetical protein
MLNSKGMEGSDNGLLKNPTSMNEIFHKRNSAAISCQVLPIP